MIAVFRNRESEPLRVDRRPNDHRKLHRHLRNSLHAARSGRVPRKDGVETEARREITGRVSWILAQVG
ncbi:MAG: hypothetical protein H0U67_08735 [Gemmatimonadetes bacterium]|nr:hypothetical protein [Gemmatimonadota bacterium]